MIHLLSNLCIILILCAFTSCSAQDKIDQEEDVFVVVDEQPEFQGGQDSLRYYLKQTVQYPDLARKAGVEGYVIVKFFVETDGRLTNIKIQRGLGYGCDEEAIRVVKAMPSWKPAMRAGVHVRVPYSLPILLGKP